MFLLLLHFPVVAVNAVVVVSIVVTGFYTKALHQWRNWMSSQKRKTCFGFRLNTRARCVTFASLSGPLWCTHGCVNSAKYSLSSGLSFPIASRRLGTSFVTGWPTISTARTWTPRTWAQIHQRSTYSFYVRRSKECKKDWQLDCLFYAFGICMGKSCM